MFPVNVISPSPADPLTFKPPSSCVTPTLPVKVTFPVPDVIVNASLSPPFVSNKAPNETVPPPDPVLIVVNALFCKMTPEVAKPTLAFVVVKVTALDPPDETTIFCPPVAAV